MPLDGLISHDSDGDTDEEHVLISKGPCPDCGSSDACATYTDGTFCFSCGQVRSLTGEVGGISPCKEKPRRGKSGLLSTEPFDKTLRGLYPKTTQIFGYHTAEFRGNKVHAAPYRDQDGDVVVAQHLRTKDKDFPWINKKASSKLQLFGQHLWKTGGRMLVVTEGEIDAMSVAQAMSKDLKWPAVSIVNGVLGAHKDIANNLEFVESFESVIFMFDMDDPGQEAAQKCVKVLSPGKAKIARLPLKDANEMLQAGRSKELVDAIWNAKTWRPEGMVTLADVREKALTPVEMGMPWWTETLTKYTYGRRYGEVITLGAGTGVGKTDFLTQQVLFDIKDLGHKVGVFFLEQQPEETAQRLCGKLAGKTFHVPHDASESDGPRWTQEELVDAFDKIEALDGLFMFDHFGCASWSEIELRIRHLYHAEGVKIFYVDHLTALADTKAERESLEEIMGKIGGLVKELDILLHLVSHLTTPDGKPHEEGGRVMIRHFKGSRSIGFWSHCMVGLERDQQNEDQELRKTTTVRLLKCRLSNRYNGSTFELSFNDDTGRLFEKEKEDDDEAVVSLTDEYEEVF